MTTIDVLLILIGIGVIVLSATQGLVRVLIMLFAFYLICIAAGMATLAADVVHSIAISITDMFEAAPPPLAMAQVFAFLALSIPLLVAAYFVSRMAFADTTIPALRGFDNVFGTVLGVVLALLIMAVLFNTIGMAVNAPRRATPGWTSLKMMFHSSLLRPLMMDVIEIYRGALFMFSFIEYPPVFVPQG